MPRLPYAVRHRGRFYAQVRVPADLRNLYGKQILRRSLKTSEYRVALQRLPTALGEIRAEFEHARGSDVSPRCITRCISILSEAVEAYKTDRKSRWSWKMTVETNFVLGTLIAAIGDKPLAEIERADLRAYRDLARRLPPNFTKRRETRGKPLLEVAEVAERLGWPTVSRGTLNRYTGHAHALFEWLVNEHLIERNPAKGLSVSRGEGHAEHGDRARFPRTQARQPFGLDALKTLLNDTPWSSGDQSHVFYWPVLVSLYQGTRQAETLQIRREDVVAVDGTLCISITDEGQGQRLKNRASKRVLPVHPLLLSCGFAEHVEHVATGRFIMPRIKTDGRGRYDWFSKAFAEHLRLVGLEDHQYHGLRHSFRDALRASETPLEVSKRLGGWAVDGVSERYGSNNPIRVLEKYLSRVQYGVEALLTDAASRRRGKTL